MRSSIRRTGRAIVADNHAELAASGLLAFDVEAVPGLIRAKVHGVDQLSRA